VYRTDVGESPCRAIEIGEDRVVVIETQQSVDITLFEKRCKQFADEFRAT